MIKLVSNEYREGNNGIRNTKLTLFGIPLYYSRIATTNSMIVRQLTVVEENKLKINGFNNK